MKQLGILGIIGGAALLIAAPFSLQWSQKNVSLSLDSAEARGGGNRDENCRRQPKGSPKAYGCAVFGTVVFCDVPRDPFNVGADRYRPAYISPPAEQQLLLTTFQFRDILQLPLACGVHLP